MTERHQRPVRPGRFSETISRPHRLGGRDLGVVGVDRREMGEHPAAVEPLPPERVVRELVGRVPRQLLGDEPPHPAGGVQLRHAGRVAEHVGNPDLGAALPEPALEPALTVHDLARQAFTRRQVHVGLDPHPADGQPLSLSDLVGDPLEQLGMALLDPGVLLGLRAGEPILGVVVHQPHRRRKRSCALADRLSDRPQPCSVDVGMADRHDVVGAGGGGCRQQRSQSGPHRRHVGQTVERPGDREPESVAPRITLRHRPHHTRQHIEIVDERLRLAVDQQQLGTPQPIQRPVAGGVGRTQR